MTFMELYSGQGRISLTKLNPDGSVQPEFFLGNAPFFSVNFRTGDVEIVLDELKDESLEIICGSPVSKNDEATTFTIGEGSPFEYRLVFSGINTASEDSRWRVELARVNFSASEGWDFISEEFAKIKIRGVARVDESGKRGMVYRLHKESVTGNRLTNAQQVVST